VQCYQLELCFEVEVIFVGVKVHVIYFVRNPVGTTLTCGFI
jgi:hypothetical protein